MCKNVSHWQTRNETLARCACLFVFLIRAIFLCGRVYAWLSISLHKKIFFDEKFFSGKTYVAIADEWIIRSETYFWRKTVLRLNTEIKF